MGFARDAFATKPLVVVESEAYVAFASEERALCRAFGGAPLGARQPVEREAAGSGFLPRTLSEALDALEGDDVILDALGRDDAALYLRAKRGEWERYHRSVSRWELDTYLPLF